ncbi:MAG: hypothetical protein P8048_04130 [Calditrichia bacterium]|jgi:hypothetical protein
MKIFNNKGMLLIPDPEKLKNLGKKRGISTTGKKIQVTQLYCSEGHTLVNPENPKFDGEPGIHIICEGDTFWQSVYLSPFQGDHRKKFKNDFKHGQMLRIFCPECWTEFPKIAPHDCKIGAMHVALFLGPDADINNIVCVCNVWGCYSSCLRLSGEVYSEVRHQFLTR